MKRVKEQCKNVRSNATVLRGYCYPSTAEINNMESALAAHEDARIRSDMGSAAEQGGNRRTTTKLATTAVSTPFPLALSFPGVWQVDAEGTRGKQEMKCGSLTRLENSDRLFEPLRLLTVETSHSARRMNGTNKDYSNEQGGFGSMGMDDLREVDEALLSLVDAYEPDGYDAEEGTAGLCLDD
jgi:hypothetical protein